jgi:hypothetical protein
MDRFEKKFGDPEETAVLFGDYSARSTLRNNVPTKGVSMRKLFKNRGYLQVLVDEYNTSCRLYESGAELVKFRLKKTKEINEIKETKKYKNYVHTILGEKLLNNCEPVNGQPSGLLKNMIGFGVRPTIINRDLNGSLNIRLKGFNTIHDIPIPAYFDRNKTKDTKKTTLTISTDLRSKIESSLLQMSSIFIKEPKDTIDDSSKNQNLSTKTTKIRVVKKIKDVVSKTQINKTTKN